MDTKMREVLVTTFGLEGTSPAEQDAVIEKIGAVVFQSVLLRVAADMSEASQDKLEALLSTDTSPEELMAFLTKEVPNFQEVVAQEALTVKKEHDEIMSKIS